MSQSEFEQPMSPGGEPDYSEKHDITRLHSAVMREKDDPRDGNEPISLWFIAFIGLALFGGGIYLALFSGGFRADVYSIYEGGLVGPGGGASGGADAAPVELTLAEKGEKVFRQNCVACHGAGGQGQAGVYPTLIGTSWVNGSEKRLAGILLHGLQGPIEVNGNIYNGAMPAWGNVLQDEQIAGVITYIRQSWGNDAGEVLPAQIASAREVFADRSAPWTAEELLAIPEDATLPGGEGAAGDGGADADGGGEPAGEDGGEGTDAPAGDQAPAGDATLAT